MEYWSTQTEYEFDNTRSHFDNKRSRSLDIVNLYSYERSAIVGVSPACFAVLVPDFPLTFWYRFLPAEGSSSHDQGGRSTVVKLRKGSSSFGQGFGQARPLLF